MQGAGGQSVCSLYYTPLLDSPTMHIDLSTIRLLHKAVLVEPLYDPDKIGHIYLAESAKNPQSQHGIVAVAAPDADFTLGDHVLYRQWQGTVLNINGHEWLYIDDAHLLCRFDRERGQLVPRKRQVVVVPEPPQSGVVQRGLIYVPNRVFETPAIRYGTVVSLGPKCVELSCGDRVVIPEQGGYELGVVDTVYYLIDEEDLLAKECV